MDMWIPCFFDIVQRKNRQKAMGDQKLHMTCHTTSQGGIMDKRAAVCGFPDEDRAGNHGSIHLLSQYNDAIAQESHRQHMLQCCIHTSLSQSLSLHVGVHGLQLVGLPSEQSLIPENSIVLSK